MARAGRVSDIRVKAPLRDNAQRIIRFRLDELLGWRHAISDVTAVSDLHDMRIAAKRLRYALETFDVCFSTEAVINKLKAMQEAVGDIHDLDVLTGLVRAELTAIHANFESQAISVALENLSTVERSQRLRKLLSSQGRDRIRLGLYGLLAEYASLRATMFASFQNRWQDDALDTFADDVVAAIELPNRDADADRGPPDEEPEAESEYM
jgi:hypothetical protein